MTARPRFTLGDLLAQEPFALELLAGGPDAAERQVLGAHTVEIDHPTRWLAEGWIMLTTGLRLRGRTDEQVALVAELQQANAAALGFGVGLAFKRVPPALLEEARGRDFPVFAVPFGTNFRDIIRFIEGWLVGADAHVFRRLTALQRFLLDALSTPEPERAIVERLSRFLDVSVTVLDQAGRLEVGAGDAPIEELQAGVAGQPPALLEFERAGWRAVATPVEAGDDAAPRWLVLASRRGFSTQLIKPAATATAPLLAATATLREGGRDRDLPGRAALLRELVEPSESHDPRTLAARAAAFGIDFSSPARVVIVKEHPCSRDPSAPANLDALADAVAARLEQFCSGYLVTPRARTVTALAQLREESLRMLLDDLARACPGCVIGVGRAVDDLRATHHSLRDAEFAAHRAGLKPGRHALTFEGFDLPMFLISEIPPERLASRVRHLTAALRANEPLRDALLAYFDHDLDVTAAAGALHLHPNSMRYRLSRVEQLLDVSLRKPSAITSLYLALLAEESDLPI